MQCYCRCWFLSGFSYNDYTREKRSWEIKIKRFVADTSGITLDCTYKNRKPCKYDSIAFIAHAESLLHAKCHLRSISRRKQVACTTCKKKPFPLFQKAITGRQTCTCSTVKIMYFRCVQNPGKQYNYNALYAKISMLIKCSCFALFYFTFIVVKQLPRKIYIITSQKVVIYFLKYAMLIFRQ